MTFDRQKVKEREIRALHNRKIRLRNTLVAWSVLISVALVLFILGTAFGRHTNTMPGGQAEASPVVKAEPEIYADQSVMMPESKSTETLELTSTKETAKDLPGLSLDHELQKAMFASCQKYNVPFALVLAVAEKESNFNPEAISQTDDHGIMQINRCNFSWLIEAGIDPLTHEGNIEAGTLMLSNAVNRYEDYNLALMAYNCGDTGAKKLWDAGTYSTSYSRSVIELYKKWTAILEEQ